MTASNAPSDKECRSASRQQTLTMVFALLTLLLALSASIVSNRLHTLALNDRAANRAASVANAAEFQAATASLQTLAGELEAAKQAREEALGEAKRLRQQHAAAVKALEASKIELVRANQTIAELKTAPPVENPVPATPLIPEASAPDGDGSTSDALTVHGFTDTGRTVQ